LKKEPAKAGGVNIQEFTNQMKTEIALFVPVIVKKLVYLHIFRSIEILVLMILKSRP
jgi:hypothetical protein